MSELQRLRDRIEELEQILGIDRSMTTRLRAALQITKDQARVLGMLLSRNIATHESLYIALYGARPDCDQPQFKILDVQICHLRARLKRHGIAVKTHWGEGWSVSPADKIQVRQMMLDAVDMARVA